MMSDPSPLPTDALRFALGDRDDPSDPPQTEIRELQILASRLARDLGVTPVLDDGIYGRDTHEAVQSIAWFLGLTEELRDGLSHAVWSAVTDPGDRSKGALSRATERGREMGTPLSPGEVVLGAPLLSAIDGWGNWIYRRVEAQVISGDLRRVRRHQSVDCDASRAIPPPAEWSMAGHGLLPLTWVTKWKMTDFDLRDEAGASLPLASRKQHGTMSAAMLMCLATSVIEGQPPTSDKRTRIVPREIEEDIRAIAREEADVAWHVWSGLGVTRSGSDEARRWRRLLVESARFMDLAYDLSQSFLLTVVLPSTAHHRRIVKFRYAALGRSPSLTASSIDRSARAALSVPLEDAQDDHLTDRSGVGHLHIHTSAQTIPRDPRRGAPAPMPVRGFHVCNHAAAVRRFVSWSPGAPSVVANLVPGDYEITPHLADTCVLEGPPVLQESVAARQIKEVVVEVRELRVAPRKDYDVVAALVPRDRWWLRVSRNLGLRSSTVLLERNLAQGGSVHLDVVAPEGMQVTRAKLVGANGQILDIVLESSERVSLYVPLAHADDPRACVLVNMRPRPDSAIYGAAVTGLLASGLLVVLAALWWVQGHSVPEAAAAALAVPGGFATYVAQGVNAKTSGLGASWLQGVALAPGFAAFAGAAIVVASGSTSVAGRFELTGAAILALVATMTLMVVLRCAMKPPEQRPTLEAQGPRFAKRYAAVQAGQAARVRL